jgi:hypothetical protein
MTTDVSDLPPCNDFPSNFKSGGPRNVGRRSRSPAKRTPKIKGHIDSVTAVLVLAGGTVPRVTVSTDCAYPIQERCLLAYRDLEFVLPEFLTTAQETEGGSKLGQLEARSDNEH